jgi:hypothetical protein
MSVAQAALASRHKVNKVKSFLIAMKVIKWLIMNCSTVFYIWAKVHLFSKIEHNIQHIFFQAEKTSFAKQKNKK